MYETLLYNRLSDYIENIFKVILCGFRKGHSTQHALFKLLQSWQNELDEKGMTETVLMDLSNAYNCIPHDLLIANLSAYCIVSVGPLLISDYFSHRKPRTKIGSCYSFLHYIIRGIPQGLLLGPLFFNIFINDLFLYIR